MPTRLFDCWVVGDGHHDQYKTELVHQTEEALGYARFRALMRRPPSQLHLHITGFCKLFIFGDPYENEETPRNLTVYGDRQLQRMPRLCPCPGWVLQPLAKLMLYHPPRLHRWAYI